MFQGMVDSAAFIRVRFGGGAPTLPTPRVRPVAWSYDFQPDPEAPEWARDDNPECPTSMGSGRFDQA